MSEVKMKSYLKEGDLVFVDKRCMATRDHHGLDSPMKNVFGTVQIVAHIRSPNTILLKNVGNYWWHPDDLTILDEQDDIKDDIKPVLFDVELLQEV